MPNECFNYITITGDQKDLVNFFNGMVDPSEDRCQKYTYANYAPIIGERTADACVSAWGTKWDCDDVDFEYAHSEIRFAKCNSILLSYSSAWTPPIGWLQSSSALFPDLEFKIEFTESGCGIYGAYEYKNGEPLREEDFDYETEYAFATEGIDGLESYIECILDCEYHEFEIEGDEFTEKEKEAFVNHSIDYVRGTEGFEDLVSLEELDEIVRRIALEMFE